MLMPGGSQLYCCTGFIPSAVTNTDNLQLLGRAGLSSRDVHLDRRGISPSLAQKECLTSAALATGVLSLLGIYQAKAISGRLKCY